jgi:hypothetical protein
MVQSVVESMRERGEREEEGVEKKLADIQKKV